MTTTPADLARAAHEAIEFGWYQQALEDLDELDGTLRSLGASHEDLDRVTEMRDRLKTHHEGLAALETMLRDFRARTGAALGVSS